MHSSCQRKVGHVRVRECLLLHIPVYARFFSCAVGICRMHETTEAHHVCVCWCVWSLDPPSLPNHHTTFFVAFSIINVRRCSILL